MGCLSGGKYSRGMRVFSYIINQTNNASKGASGAESPIFFAPRRHSADQFPIACSDSPHFEEAARWLYYRGTGRRRLIKLTAVITRSLPCHGSGRRMEQRCDGKGQEALVPQCARRVFPVALDLKSEGRRCGQWWRGPTTQHVGCWEWGGYMCFLVSFKATALFFCN